MDRAVRTRPRLCCAQQAPYGPRSRIFLKPALPASRASLSSIAHIALTIGNDKRNRSCRQLSPDAVAKGRPGQHKGSDVCHSLGNSPIRSNYELPSVRHFPHPQHYPPTMREFNSASPCEKQGHIDDSCDDKNSDRRGNSSDRSGLGVRRCDHPPRVRCENVLHEGAATFPWLLFQWKACGRRPAIRHSVAGSKRAGFESKGQISEFKRMGLLACPLPWIGRLDPDGRT